MSGKLFIKTHGCQMNEYDSAKMADVLKASHGLELTQDESEADVILINTCSIRETAQCTARAVGLPDQALAAAAAPAVRPRS